MTLPADLMPAEGGFDGGGNTGLRVIPASARPGLALLDRLRSAQRDMLEAALSEPGLGLVAELAADAVGGAVAIVIPPLTVAIAPDHAGACSDASALSGWVSARTRGGPVAVPSEVLAAVPIRFRDDTIGVVALLRSEQPPHPYATEYLHLASVAALSAVAVEHARTETEHRLRGSFLEELRSHQSLDGSEIVRRAARLGCDLTAGAVILCAAPRGHRPRLVGAMIAAEHPGAIVEELAGAGDDGDASVLYAVLPARDGAGGDTGAVSSARRLASRLERHAVVGLSSLRVDPAELGQAVEEAELMLEVLRRAGGPGASEIDGGTYPLLFRLLASHPAEVRSFYEATVAAVASYDDRYGTELVATLQAYLDANCNMNATATAIFAHRHTVAYRLERVRDLTGLDPMLSEHRERLGLGLKVHRIVSSRQ